MVEWAGRTVYAGEGKEHFEKIQSRKERQYRWDWMERRNLQKGRIESMDHNLDIFLYRIRNSLNNGKL